MLTDIVVATSGPVFVVSGRSGNIQPRTSEGFYAYDTRFLSRFHLSVQGRTPVLIGSGIVNHALNSFYLSSSGSRNLPSGTLSIVRDRYISHGLHEDISVVNHSGTARTVRLDLNFDADFADVFEVRRLGPVRKVGRVTAETAGGRQLRLVYRRGDFHRETWINFSQTPEVKGKTATFDIDLPPRGMWSTCVTILPVLDDSPPPVECVADMLEVPFAGFPDKEALYPVSQEKEAEGPLVDVPVLETDNLALRQAYSQAIDDLRALRMEHEKGNYILAAGLPWFMAVFGRDSIISAIQTKLLGPELLAGTLHTLADLQATQRDDFRDAQPGKIPHEVRQGELSILEEVPHWRYYGSVDATPLFLILFWETYQWTGDTDLLRRYLPAAEAALSWIEHYGDPDQDGFVEYQRRTRKGLLNQCWKDSHDSISFADGTLAKGPIAMAEVQGYVYDAKRKMAEIYRLLGEPEKAQRMNLEAQRLKEQFNEAFWMPDQGFYALALDGSKRQVDSITSNPGHCLWSGIVDVEKAGQVAERLMAPDMFSGWGIRTLSTKMGRYNPVSYHNGSVWPHDNSIIVAGLARYGFTEEAREVTFSLLAAAAGFPDHRLPELFAGFPRRRHSFPVSYPAANAPQAWASGAVIHLLETLLGVTPRQDRLLLEAPTEGLSISLSGVPYRGSRRIL